LEFTGKKDLVARLRVDAEALVVWFEGRYEEVEFLVKDSVGSSTFRAFAHMPHPPSQIFYNWAGRC